jgi:hypothetical protein
MHDAVEGPELERGLPRLGEVFDLVRRRMGIYLELKVYPTTGVAARIDHVVDIGHYPRVTLSVQALRAVCRSFCRNSKRYRLSACEFVRGGCWCTRLVGWRASARRPSSKREILVRRLS